MQDLIIIGGGPAGVSAGVYASRKKLKTTLIAKDFGGQSVVSDSIENWIGDIAISGPDLAKKLEAHLRAYAGEDVQVVKGEYVQKVEKTNDGFKVHTDKNSYESKSVLVTTGSHRRKLEVENADLFEHKGITYCASCDGPMFSGKDVVVVGGGNAGFESATQLLAYTNSVTLLNRSNQFKADPITVEAALKNPKMKVIKNAQITKVVGDKFVSGIFYKDENGEEKEIVCQGIFIEIGNIPTTEMVKDLVPLDEFNRIKINPWTQRTETDGIWAAGDCTNIIYHQNNIAAGDAVKALEDIYLWVKSR